MKYISINFKGGCLGLFAALLLVNSPGANAGITVTQEQLHGSKDSELATSSDRQVVAIPPTSPEEAFEEWLDTLEIKEGPNENDDGTMFFVAQAEAAVEAKGDPKKSKNAWVQARNVAYSKAEVLAKVQLADYLATEVQSERSSQVTDMGGDTPPPMMAKVAEQLSVMDKALTLTGKALDHEIKKFDTKWDGTGRTPEEKLKRMVSIRENYTERMSAFSRLFITGAVPVINLEGTNDDGDYVVLVGIVWSPKTQALAQSILDRSITLPLDDPEPTIRDQVKNALTEDRNFLAVSSGVRLWTNENGEQAVVAFTGVDRTRSSQKNMREAGLRGRSMIAQFVAEQFVANDQVNTEVVTDTLSDEDETRETFNASKFESTVKSKSKKLTLSGVAQAYKWKGEHPVSKARMEVVVWSWTPSGRKFAGQLQDSAKKSEMEINKLTTSGTSSASGATSTTSNQTTQAPASRTRKGATTKKNKW